MSSPVVRVEGVSRLVRTMRAAELDVDELKEVTIAAGALALAAIRPRVPVRSGRLLSTVRSNRAARRSTVSAGRASLPYGPPVHWGWPARGIDGQPFGPEGLEAAEPAIHALYVAGVERIVDKIKGA